MPPCVWPEWEFVRQIGRGAYGTVYEAVRLDEFQVESRAAIKVISIPQDDAELDTLRTEGLDYNASKNYMRKVVDAFVGEVKLMITFKGVPNILSVEDYKVVERENEIGWDISIRMELLTPLYSYISDKSLTEREVAQLGCDICSALEVCAKKNVIHRDIKPGNIFINDFGSYKLGDFGIARQMESMTTELSRKGTGSYMAPEVEKGLPYNTTVDIYSLGLVLYLLLNKNRLPFLDPDKQILTPNDREMAIRRRLDGEKLPPPCDASQQMAQIILSACAYDPKRRFASATAMKNALQTITNTQDPIRAASTVPLTESTPPPVQIPPEEPADGPESSGQEQPKKKKRRRVWLIVIIVIAAAVVAGLFAARRIEGQKAVQYSSLVENQVVYRENGDTQMEESAYEQASALMPSGLETRYQHARMLHDAPASEGEPDYDACIDFIDDEIFSNSEIDQTQSRMADVWYLYADSCFQKGDYADAVDAYREVFQIGTQEPLYYRDYAIALTYDGHTSKAEEILDEAEDLGLGSDSIYYTKGEVEKARSEYVDALEDFADSIRHSEDEDLIARAYLATADIYKEQGDPESEREALIKAKNYSSDKLPQILQQLISVDIDLAEASAGDEQTVSKYRKEAIDALQLVIANGWETFQTYSNLIVLYQQEGDLDAAEEVLLSTRDSYEQDYRWYKRYAFLEVAKQKARETGDRDFTQFAEYYDMATDLYRTYIDEGGKSDDEMSVLEKQYEEIENGGQLTE